MIVHFQSVTDQMPSVSYIVIIKYQMIIDP